MTAKLNGSEDALEAIVVLSEGNPGAVTALTMMFEAAVDYLEELQIIYVADDMNLRGAALHVAYKYWAKQDPRKCIDAILSRDPDMIEAVNAEIVPQGCEPVVNEEVKP